MQPLGIYEQILVVACTAWICAMKVTLISVSQSKHNHTHLWFISNVSCKLTTQTSQESKSEQTNIKADTFQYFPIHHHDRVNTVRCYLDLSRENNWGIVSCVSQARSSSVSIASHTAPSISSSVECLDPTHELQRGNSIYGKSICPVHFS